MHLLPTATVSMLVLCLLAPTMAQAANQQRLRERLGQRMQQRRDHDAPAATLPAGTRVERDLAYGPDPNQRYDVYLPARAKPQAPILLMVHGGGWHRGDKQAPHTARARPMKAGSMSSSHSAMSAQFSR